MTSLLEEHFIRPTLSEGNIVSVTTDVPRGPILLCFATQLLTSSLCNEDETIVLSKDIEYTHRTVMRRERHITILLLLPRCN